MAELFRQKITRYVDAEGKRCQKGAPGARPLKTKSKKWYGQFKDANDRWQRVPLSTDKDVAKKRLAQLVAGADSHKFKLTDPYAEHRKRKLTAHLDDYATALRAKDRKDEYVAKQVQRIRDSAKACGFEYLHDIDELKLAAYLKQRRRGEAIEFDPTKDTYTTTEVAKLLGRPNQAVFRLAKRHEIPREGKQLQPVYARASVEKLLGLCARGLSPSSSNGYAVAFKGFMKWAVKNRRIEDDPLKGLETLNAKKDRRHQRRTLTVADFQKFLDVTSTAPVYRGLSGFDRVLIYWLAVSTGFRAKEISGLTPSHFDHECKNVFLSANETKNGRAAQLPIRKELGSVLSQYLRERSSTALIWPENWLRNAAEMVRLDLQRAGLPYRNEKSAVFDFHALRRQFVSDLIEAEVQPKVIQTLARHSTIQMTMDVYGELKKESELTRAINAMPGYTPGYTNSTQFGAADGSSRQ